METRMAKSSGLKVEEEFYLSSLWKLYLCSQTVSKDIIQLCV